MYSIGTPYVQNQQFIFRKSKIFVLTQTPVRFKMSSSVSQSREGVSFMDYLPELIDMLKQLTNREIEIIYYIVRTILEGRGR